MEPVLTSVLGYRAGVTLHFEKKTLFNFDF